MVDDNELVTAHVLADSLNLAVDTIWRYTREKKIPFVELGSKHYRYRLADVIKALDRSAVRENTAGYKIDTTKKLTYQDYMELPEEPGYRFEVIDGILVKEPSPSVLHQRVSRKLQRIMEDYFWKTDPGGEIFGAPLDVTFQDITVVQPDLFYISGEQKHIIKEMRIDGPPKLVVEIMSPSTGRKDRLQKMRIYRHSQVQHYWLVNPEEKTLECFSLRDGIYALVALGMDEDIMEHPEFPELLIDLKVLWPSSFASPA